jgi:hypothetical protein
MSKKLVFNNQVESIVGGFGYWSNNNYPVTVWVDDNNKFHREDGPAIEDADGTRLWYKHGKRHRESGPAAEFADGYEEWWLNGVRFDDEKNNS